MNKSAKYISIVLIMILLISCSKAQRGEYTQNSNEELRFTIAVDDFATRGAMITSCDNLPNFSFSSYIFSVVNGYNTIGDNHCENQKVVESDDEGVWECENRVVLWPSDSDLGLLLRAYAPYATAENGIEFRPEAQTSRYFVIDYTMPKATASQPDLLVATPPGAFNTNDNGGVVKLHFSHALSALKFSVRGDENKRVKSITMENIVTQATLTIDAKDNSQNWDYAEAQSSFPVDINTDVAPSDDPSQDTGDYAGESLMLDNDYVMVIPQSLPSDAKLVVEYCDVATPDVTKTLTLNLSTSIIWRVGISYNYVINFKSTTLEASQSAM